MLNGKLEIGNAVDRSGPIPIIIFLSKNNNFPSLLKMEGVR